MAEALPDDLHADVQALWDYRDMHHQQRRAYATCEKLWPEVDVICASRPLPLDDCIESIGDADRVINMLVGDTQRITDRAERGSPSSRKFPVNVEEAYGRLVRAGLIKRLT